MMQLMQLNWFLDRRRAELRSRRPAQLSIDYGRYRAGGRRDLLARGAGAPGRRRRRRGSDAFINRWGRWDEALHGRIAAAMRAQQRYRYRLVTYAALGQ